VGVQDARSVRSGGDGSPPRPSATRFVVGVVVASLLVLAAVPAGAASANAVGTSADLSPTTTATTTNEAPATSSTVTTSTTADADATDGAVANAPDPVRPPVADAVRQPPADDDVAVAPLLSAAAMPDTSWDIVPEIPADRSYVAIVGEPDDFVTQGDSFLYTQENARIRVQGDLEGFLVGVDGDENWNGSFSRLNGSGPLGVGTHVVTRDPFTDVVSAQFGGRGPGCDGIGWLAIDEAVEDAEGIPALTLRYEQSCYGRSPMHVKVRWLRDDPTVVPGPAAVPPGLWDVSPQVRPDQSYLFVDGAAGSGITDERDFLFTLANSRMWLEEYVYGALNVNVVGEQRWDALIEAMYPLGRVEVGYYPEMGGYGGHNPTRGGMSWYGNDTGGEGQACGRSEGWLAVDELRREGGEITSLTLRFEQACTFDGVRAPAIRGKLRWRADDPTVAPGPVVPPPSDLWDVAPPVGAGVDYLQLVPDPDDPSGPAGPDPITRGEPTLIAPGPGGFRIVESLWGLHAQTTDGSNWSVDFGDFGHLGKVVPGYSGIVRSDPSDDLPQGGFSMSGNGAGCGNSISWYSIDRLVRIGGEVVSLEARFMTRCPYGQAPLYGKLRVGSASAVTTPFVGNLETATTGPGTVRVGGWAALVGDPTPIAVEVEVDGRRTSVRADLERPDVAAALPGAGPAHGFDLVVPASASPQRVCVYALDLSRPERHLVGCRDVLVPGGWPVGNLEQVAGRVGGLAISGWAVDPDTTGSIDVHVYVDGRPTARTALVPRSDIAAVYPLHGANHGFEVVVPAESGVHEVCVFAINVGAGANTVVGCRSAVVPGGPPVGNVEAVAPSLGSVQVSGWVIDPDTIASTAVHVYVDGIAHGAAAGRPRPDVGAAFPGYGANHGFAVEVPASAGRHRVCVFGINVGAGSNSVLGCRDVVVPDGSPVGNLEVAAAGIGEVRLSGWALDPETSDPVDVHVYVDGNVDVVRADGNRPDVGAVYPALGPGHGWSVTMLAGGGPQRVCAFAINQGSGANTLLGCREVVVPNGPPIGSLEAVTGGAGSIRVQGWAIDPDTTWPIDVHVYVDGAYGWFSRVGLVRPDVGAAFPGFGAEHGFDSEVPVPPGRRQVCVFAFNVGVGANTVLGCRTVTVG
jgi:hypothetical protein